MRIPRIYVALAAAALPLTFAPRQLMASPISLVVDNFSFESPVQGDGGQSVNSVTGWDFPTPSYSAGVTDLADADYPGTTGSPGTVPGGDGVQAAYVGNNGTADPSRLEQDLSATLNPGGLNLLQIGQYTLTVAVGDRTGPYHYTVGSYMIKLVAVTGPSTFVDLASATGDAATLPLGVFTDKSVPYLATASDPYLGLPLRIRLENAGAVSTYDQYDNVRLTLLVPEPSAAGLLATGVLLAWRRRR
jgi:hypothetical protein